MARMNSRTMLVGSCRRRPSDRVARARAVPTRNGYDEVGRNVSLTFADGPPSGRSGTTTSAASWSVATRTRPDRDPDHCIRRELRRGGQRGVALRSGGDGDHRGRRPDRVKTVTRLTGGVESYAYNSLGARHERRRRARCAASSSRRRGHGGRPRCPRPRRRPRHPRPRRARHSCFETRRSRSARDGCPPRRRQRPDAGRTVRGRHAAAPRVGEHTERASGVRVRGANAVGVMRHRHVLVSTSTPLSSAGSSTASTTPSGSPA